MNLKYCIDHRINYNEFHTFYRGISKQLFAEQISKEEFEWKLQYWLDSKRRKVG